ncbi:hypothetical protein BW247_04225 [Acidihalobacter ferrooxydans]|uniref:peptidylprolyl isomerase n=2 Tax=Acidihalobacter ferrooxydans TaxID=1765967 RepID=A0A1P8UEY3_9GAMM|nr:hypothetical protein BW247_04225 [Acidihalobacter ferrooxydans]
MTYASLALVLSLGLLGGCQTKTDSSKSSTPSTPAASSPTVATVNGKAITQADLNAYRTVRAAQLPNVKLSEKALLQELVDMRLLEQAAIAAGINKQPSIHAKIEQQRANTLIEALLQQKFGAKKYSDAELKQEYDQLTAQSGQEEYKAAHILVKTKAEAEKIIADLNKGANFATLAKKYSTAPSASKGGELGWFTAQTMVPPFAAAVEKLKKGEYTKTPVHTRFGWHVILLQNTRKVTPPPFAQVKSRIQTLLTQQAIEKYVQSLQSKAKITIDLPKTAPTASATSTSGHTSAVAPSHN